MDQVQRTRPTPIHAPKAKPDPGPMRLALGAGGIAALSALATAIVLPPRIAPVVAPVAPQQTADPQQQQAVAPQASATPIQVVRPIQYVQLLPGQTAPPGATVIDPSAPTPITMVVNIAAPPAQAGAQPPAQKAPAPAPIIIKTTQSGKPVP
jgi:hypothetical protein